jgi:hypothetical protein
MGQTEPVNRSTRTDKGGNERPVGSTTKRGSQEADDDDRPAEWHARTNKRRVARTDDWNRGQSMELPTSARGMNDGREGMNKKGI